MKGHALTREQQRELARQPRPDYRRDRAAYNRWLRARHACGMPVRRATQTINVQQVLGLFDGLVRDLRKAHAEYQQRKGGKS